MKHVRKVVCGFGRSDRFKVRHAGQVVLGQISSYHWKFKILCAHKESKSLALILLIKHFLVLFSDSPYFIKHGSHDSLKSMTTDQSPL